jgi:hypothetical protein
VAATSSVLQSSAISEPEGNVHPASRITVHITALLLLLQPFKTIPFFPYLSGAFRPDFPPVVFVAILLSGKRRFTASCLFSCYTLQK